MEPATEGATVTFECPLQYVLTGPNITTCMGNGSGEWEPDPGEVECNGKTFLATSQIITIKKTGKPAGSWGLHTLALGRVDKLITVFIGLNLENTEESRSTNSILTAAVSSTVAAFIAISPLTIFAGSVCGYCFVRRRDKQSPSSSQLVPLYEDVNVLPNARTPGTRS